jgi:hypothetical protein
VVRCRGWVEPMVVLSDVFGIWYRDVLCRYNSFVGDFGPRGSGFV